MPPLTAEEFYAAKTTVPSAMTSAQWERVQVDVRERAFFMAAVTRAEVADVFRAATGRVLSGEISEAEARREIRAGLARTGYAANPGEEGTIKDLSTLKRQDVVIRTNLAMARNYATYQKQWVARRAFPAKRMMRLQSRMVPRNWQARWAAAASGLADADAGTMTALLDSPVWSFISRFGAPYAPYDFNSGMGDIPVTRAEAEAALGKPAVDAWLEESVPGAPPKPQPGAAPRATPGAVPTIQPPNPRQPIPGFNSTLQVTPNISTPQGKQDLDESTRGLTEWQGGVLIYTDPNGTRPYPATALPAIIGTPNQAGVPLLQADALRAWASGGSPALPAGTDRLADFSRLVWRTLPMVGNPPLTLTTNFPTAAVRAAALANLQSGSTWAPQGRFPFIALAKAGKAIGISDRGFPLVLRITRHRTARDLTPSVEELAEEDAHGHHVLIPHGARFRVESVDEPATDTSAVTVQLTEEGAP